jgi:hypothetical protein
MFLNPKQIQEIIDLLQRSHWFFIAHNLGSQYVPPDVMKQLKKLGFTEKKILSYPDLAFHFGMLSAYLKEDEVKKFDFYKLKQAVMANKYVPLTESEKFSVSMAEQRAVEGITGLGNRISSNIRSLIIEASQKEKRLLEKLVGKKAKQAIAQRQTKKQFASKLSELSKDWERDFNRIADYVFHEAYDNGRALYITKTRGKDALVYKRVHSEVCNSCFRLYIKNRKTGEPKIFKLSELTANGNNIGRKQSDWKPVVGATHPWSFLNPKTKIYTDEGYKNIKSIRVGDNVLTHKGRFRKVTKLIWHRFDKQDIYNIKVRDTNGNNIKICGVTGNHPFQVEKENIWVELDYIKIGDKLFGLYSGCEECNGDISLKYRNDRKSELKFCSKSCNVSVQSRNRWKEKDYRKIMLKHLEKGQTEEARKRQKISLIKHYKNLSEIQRRELTKAANKKIRKMWRNGELEHTLENLKKQKKSYTGLERKMKWLLETLKVKFIQQFMVERNTFTNGAGMGKRKRRFYLDFYLPEYNLAIECNGDYFHKDKRKDIVRASIIKSLIGSETIFFTQKQLKNLSKCRERLKRIFNNHNGKYRFKKMKLVEKKLMNNNAQSLRNYGKILYNFSVEEDESYIANGIIVHNCRCDLEYIPTGWEWSQKDKRFKPVVKDTKRMEKIRSGIKIKIERT